MAKVTGPLMSISASGKVADSIVFMSWRGIPTVRKWLKPSNPNTAAQQTARGTFTAAVAKYRMLSTVDVAAWRIKASGLAKTGFNFFVGLYSSAIAAGKEFTTISDVSTASVTATGFAVKATPDTTELLSVRVGTAVGVYSLQFNEVNATPLADTERTITITGLTTGIKYYYEVFVPETASASGTTGIYNQITA